jgi:ABC-2 type transport system permease protein
VSGGRSEGRGNGLRDIVRAEWAKVLTLPAARWALASVPLLGVAFGVMVAAGQAGDEPDGAPDDELARMHPLFPSLLSLTLAQLGLVVFGVLAAGGEFRGGLLRASLLAVPRRGRFFAGKALAAAVPAAAVSLVTVAATYGVTRAVLGERASGLREHGTIWALAGAWLYLTLITLISLGAAMVLRGSARALGLLLPLLFLSSQGLGNVPVLRSVLQFFPDQAGLVLMRLVAQSGAERFTRDYGPGTAVLLLLAWSAAVLAAGCAVLRRHEA